MISVTYKWPPEEDVIQNAAVIEPFNKKIKFCVERLTSERRKAKQKYAWFQSSSGLY